LADKPEHGGNIMKRKKWRLIVEIGGVAVVVVSLLVVVFELRQNTAAIRGSAISAVAERQQFELYWSGEMAPVFVKPFSFRSRSTRSRPGK